MAKRKTKRINTKHRNTKRKNIKRKDTKYKNTKRKGTKHKNRKKKTKKKEVYEKAGMRCLNCLSFPPRHNIALLDDSMELSVYESSTSNIIDKFFERVTSDKSRVDETVDFEPEPELDPSTDKEGELYRLNMPNNEIHIISCHGDLLPGDIIVVKDLTLYFPVGAGEYDASFTLPWSGRPVSREEQLDLCRENGIREYPSGSIIQDQVLYFYPFKSHMDFEQIYKFVISFDASARLRRRRPLQFTPRGLLKYEVTGPDTFSVKDFSEVILELIRILKFRGMWITDELGEQLQKEKWIQFFNEVYSSKFPDHYGHSAVDHWFSHPTDKIFKEFMEKHLTDFSHLYFKDNIESIISKSEMIDMIINGTTIKLSEVLIRIVEARKKDPSISDNWFCNFCRYGEPLNIEKLKACDTKKLPSLPTDFFDADIQYQGISEGLVRQSSLASKAETRNFINTFNELYSNKDRFTRKEVAKMETINRTINRLPPESTSRWFKCREDCASENTDSLSYNDVCFVFQMKQKYSSIL